MLARRRSCVTIENTLVCCRGTKRNDTALLICGPVLGSPGTTTKKLELNTVTPVSSGTVTWMSVSVQMGPEGPATTFASGCTAAFVVVMRTFPTLLVKPLPWITTVAPGEAYVTFKLST